jgi:hypothetical protein
LGNIGLILGELEQVSAGGFEPNASDCITSSNFGVQAMASKLTTNPHFNNWLTERGVAPPARVGAATAAVAAGAELPVTRESGIEA